MPNRKKGQPPTPSKLYNTRGGARTPNVLPVVSSESEDDEISDPEMILGKDPSVPVQTMVPLPKSPEGGASTSADIEMSELQPMEGSGGAGKRTKGVAVNLMRELFGVECTMEQINSMTRLGHQYMAETSEEINLPNPSGNKQSLSEVEMGGSIAGATTVDYSLIPETKRSRNSEGPSDKGEEPSSKRPPVVAQAWHTRLMNHQDKVVSTAVMNAFGKLDPTTKLIFETMALEVYQGPNIPRILQIILSMYELGRNSIAYETLVQISNNNAAMAANLKTHSEHISRTITDATLSLSDFKGAMDSSMKGINEMMMALNNPARPPLPEAAPRRPKPSITPKLRTTLFGYEIEYVMSRNQFSFTAGSKVPAPIKEETRKILAKVEEKVPFPDRAAKILQIGLQAYIKLGMSSD